MNPFEEQHYDINRALQTLRPGAQWSMANNEYSTLEWHPDNTTTKPSLEELKVEIARLKADYEYREYQRQRALEYPSIAEQLDMLYWDQINGTNNWQTTINAVKDKYPKPEIN